MANADDPVCPKVTCIHVRRELEYSLLKLNGLLVFLKYVEYYLGMYFSA